MPSKSRRGTIATSALQTPKANLLPGFINTLELSPDPTDPNNVTRSKQAVNLANLFINYTVASTASPADLRRNASTGPQIRKFHNSVQDAGDLEKSGSKLETAILDSFKRSEITPSLQTMHRAQKARANMEIHYDLLATSQGIVTQPEGIDSEEHKKFAAMPNFYCYNPLQVIRNRKARTPYIALERQEPNTSSSAGHHYWTVDISELIVEQSWRYQNYRLMRDAKGKLLYPETSMAVDRDSTPSKNMIVSRLTKFKQNLTSNNNSRNNSVFDHVSTDTDFLPQQSADERHRTGVFDVAIESIQKSKPLDLHSDSTYSSNNLNFTTTDNTNNNSNTNILSSDKKSNSSFKHTSSLRNSLVVTDDDLRQNSTESNGPPSTGSNKPRDLPADPEILPVIDMERKAAHASAKELSCLELIYLMRYLFIGNKVTVMSGKTGFVSAAAREIEVKHISAGFHQQIRAAQRDVFPRVKKAIQQTESQFHILKRAQLSQTSTRIDQLLVDTDQTINRLATTLNLEVKQLTERLDSLEIGATKVHCKWVILNACYFFLEYLLLFLMWIVWGLVSIMLGVRRVGGIFGNIVKWLLWC